LKIQHLFWIEENECLDVSRMVSFVTMLPIFIGWVEKGAYPEKGAFFLQWRIKIHLSKKR